MFKNQLSQLSNFQGLQLESDICVITVDDNISHTYCSKIKWEKDNRFPLGIAQLVMPYSEKVESYWSKYSGTVIIHANLNSHQQSITQAMASNFPNTISLNLKSIEDKIDVELDKISNKLHLKNDEYNYSYIGKVSRFKQIGKTFIVFLEDLGWKFLQKVPKEFRETYIAGQTLDDAFQAICEFMGVEFAYSIEDLNQYNFSADGYSVEKDGQIIEDVSTILSEWSAKDDEEESDEKTEDEKLADNLQDGQPFEASGLIELRRQQRKNNTNNNTVDSSLNSQIINNDGNTENTEEEKQENDTTVFDKINEYQQEFDNKIQDLFIGNTLYDSNVSDPILNYNWITIEPKAISSDTNIETGITGDGTNDDSNNNSNTSSSNFDWSRMSKIVNKYFNKNNPNRNTIIAAFRNCSDDWSCLAGTYSKYKKYCSATNQDTVIREIRACFK